MDPFKHHTGIIAPLIRDNVDTDQIIPSREMKQVTKSGLGEGLFAGWRYTDERRRAPDPDFILNRPGYRKASILLAGKNFGCGSSREHAVWALSDFGIRAIIAESFGSIFHTNCVRNGVLPIALGADETEELRQAAEAAVIEVTIDLPGGRIMWPEGHSIPFQIDPSEREMLIKGLDPISLTLTRADEINAFIKREKKRRPWLFEETTET
jgi:3-isopropylmalate/(R)-2-methylmalate dehydratase small subunit